jgi:hypothetical protein
MIYEHSHIKTVVLATREDKSALTKSFHTITGKIRVESEPRATSGQSFLHITYPSSVYQDNRCVHMLTNTALVFTHTKDLDIKKQFKEDGYREKFVSMLLTAQEKHIQKITRHVSDMDRLGHLIRTQPPGYFEELIRNCGIVVR